MIELYLQEMKNTNFPNALNLAFFLFTLFLNLNLPWNPPVWAGFGDPYDYLGQSELSLGSAEFYTPHKTPKLYPRPFTVPLFYKIAGSNPDVIIQMQKYVHSLTTFFLVYVILLFIKSNFVKYLVILSIYLFMSWWNILGWTKVLLSESLSMSLMFCWIASFLLFIKKRNLLFLVIHIIIVFLFSFTRDTWPYILIVFYGLTSITFFIWDKWFFRKSVFLLFFCIVLFFIQQHTAKVGDRFRLPVINNIVMRIIPNQEYTQWFSDHGMPCTDSLKKNFSNINFYDSTRIRVFMLYNDSSYNLFHSWVSNRGKKTYTKFIVTHPKFSFLLEENKQNLNRIFDYNLSYTGGVNGYSWGVQYIFPLFNTWLILILGVILILVFIRDRVVFLLFPIILVIIFSINVLLSYNADAFEVERHLFITNIIIQFVGLLSVAILLDKIIGYKWLKKWILLKSQNKS